MADGATPSPAQMLAASRSAPPEILDQILQIYGGRLLRALLESDEARGDRLLRVLSKEPWRRLAGDQQAIMRAWLADNPPSVSLARGLVEVLSPSQLGGVPLQHWIQILPDRLSAVDGPIAVGLFALAMSRDSREAGVLAGRTFASVHQAAKTSSLSDVQWKALSASLPSVPKWMEWDRCERLRRGFVDAFLTRKPWQFVDFVVPFESDNTTLEAVCAYARSDERGRKFLRKLAEAIESGRVKVGSAQRQIIEEGGRTRLSDYLSF